MSEQQAIDKMHDLQLLHGSYSTEKCGHPLSYYLTRRIFLDCRGPLKIHPETEWGWEVMVLTQSHDISNWSGKIGKATSKPVIVEKGAWICSRALLYNCVVGEGAIVAAGAVVRSMTVPAWTIVEGNPARVVRRLREGTKDDRLAQGVGTACDVQENRCRL